jgi:hypothetical protein
LRLDGRHEALENAGPGSAGAPSKGRGCALSKDDSTTRRWSMNRAIASAILALIVGLLLGPFLIGPLLSRTATAQEKKAAAAGKGKCVGVFSGGYKNNRGKDVMVIGRAFEDGAVEFYSVAVGDGYVPPARWEPARK